MSIGELDRLALVVEDDDNVRDMICEILQSEGFRVLGCRSGKEGLKAARDCTPSVVTLDLHMPGMDGVEVLQKLGEDEATSSLPVVVVSAYATDRRIRTGGQVKAVVHKPFDVDDLCTKVRSAADGRVTPTRYCFRRSA